MKLKHFFVLAAALAVPFIFYILLKPNFIGFDSYYFLDFVCNNGNIDTQNLATQAIFSILPCNFAIIKTLQYFLALIALVGVVKTGELFYRNGWLAGLFVFLSPIWFWEFMKLENEVFAFPILVWAIYFLTKGLKKNKIKEKVIGIGLIFVAGAIWEGAVYYFVPYAFLTLLVSPILLVSLIVFQTRFFGSLTTNNMVYENMAFVGLIHLGVFLIAILGLFLDMVIAIPGLFWLIVTTMNAKFYFHVVPFLAIGTLLLYNHPNLNNLDKKYNKSIWKTVKLVLIITPFIFVFVFGYSVAFAQPPTIKQTSLINEFVQFQKQGFEVKNDWSYGYLVNFYGGNASAWGGGIWEQDYNSGIVLTQRDLNCELLNKANEIKLYDCN